MGESKDNSTNHQQISQPLLLLLCSVCLCSSSPVCGAARGPGRDLRENRDAELLGWRLPATHHRLGALQRCVTLCPPTAAEKKHLRKGTKSKLVSGGVIKNSFVKQSALLCCSSSFKADKTKLIIHSFIIYDFFIFHWLCDVCALFYEQYAVGLSF